MRRLFAVLAAGLVIAACGSSHHTSTDSSPSTTSAAKPTNDTDATAVHDALQAAGLDCTNFAIDTSEGMDIGPKPTSSGTCTLLQEKMSIDVYKNAEVRDNADGMASKVGCSFAKSFGISRLTWVDLENATVSGDTSETAKAIHDKLGGTVQDIKC